MTGIAPIDLTDPEDGVAQRLQSAHFEKTDLLQPRSPLKAAEHETRPCFQL
jgi:hypothetical protein